MYKIESVEFENVGIKYKLKSKSTLICNGLNLKLYPGKIYGLLGPNGSGKTSLVKALLGQIEHSGKINFAGAEKNTRPIIAYVPQDFRSSFFNWTSLKKNIDFALNSSVQSEYKNRTNIEDQKEELGIDLDLKLMPKKCSGGMLQQAAILRAVMTNTGIIVGDEPFSALDVEIKGTLRENFRKYILKSKCICLLIMHNLEDVANICDEVFIIKNKPYSNSKEKIEEGFKEIKTLTNELIFDEQIEISTDSLYDLTSKLLTR